MDVLGIELVNKVGAFLSNGFMLKDARDVWG